MSTHGVLMRFIFGSVFCAFAIVYDVASIFDFITSCKGRTLRLSSKKKPSENYGLLLNTIRNERETYWPSHKTSILYVQLDQTISLSYRKLSLDSSDLFNCLLVELWVWPAAKIHLCWYLSFISGQDVPLAVLRSSQVLKPRCGVVSCWLSSRTKHL